MTIKMTRCEFVHGLKCEEVSRRITSLEQERDSAREQLHNALDDTRWLNEQNDKLKELCYEIWEKARLLDANEKIKGMRILDEYGRELEERMRELGIRLEDE